MIVTRALLALLPAAALADPLGTPADLTATARGHLARLAAEPWGAAWKDAKVSEARIVPPKADLSIGPKLPPVGYAAIVSADGAPGYLMWEDATLVEFALDQKIDFTGKTMTFVQGVEATQQFPLKHEGKQPAASGCVPTSAASLVWWWSAEKTPKWRGDARNPRELTRRLRGKLAVSTIPDRDGFTDGAMDLTGARMPAMAETLARDAATQQAATVVEMTGLDELPAELAAGRPALLSCYVRVPHKPGLSWGHAVVGVGATAIKGQPYLGVADNFFPTRNRAAVRWIHRKFFQPRIITVRPADPATPSASSPTPLPGS